MNPQELSIKVAVVKSQIAWILRSKPVTGLVRKQIINKNGKRQTVLVRPDSAKKEIRKPAFSLTQDEGPAVQGSFNFNSEEVTRNDYKPDFKLKESGNTAESIIEGVKMALVKQGLDKKAKEFIDRAFSATSMDDLVSIAKDFVNVSGNLNLSKPDPAQADLLA